MGTTEHETACREARRAGLAAAVQVEAATRHDDPATRVARVVATYLDRVDLPDLAAKITPAVEYALGDLDLSTAQVNTIVERTVAVALMALRPTSADRTPGGTAA